jgi:hypothetical protein
MGRVARMREINSTEFSLTSEDKTHFGYLVILKKQGVRVWTAFIWIRIWTIGVFL